MSATQTDLETVFPQKAIRFLRLPEVLSFTGIGSKSDLYRRIRAKTFPAGQRLSHRVVVWPEPVVADWQRSQLPDALKSLLT